MELGGADSRGSGAKLSQRGGNRHEGSRFWALGLLASCSHLVAAFPSRGPELPSTVPGDPSSRKELPGEASSTPKLQEQRPIFPGPGSAPCLCGPHEITSARTHTHTRMAPSSSLDSVMSQRQMGDELGKEVHWAISPHQLTPSATEPGQLRPASLCVLPAR